VVIVDFAGFAALTLTFSAFTTMTKSPVSTRLCIRLFMFTAQTSGISVAMRPSVQSAASIRISVLYVRARILTVFI
jgi:hypothetical protein